MEATERYEIRDQLRRILASKHFAKTRKRNRFLEFVCEQALLGNADKLNEYLLGVEVYGRGPDFNPQEDAIVRVQASDIRKSLRDYYADEGKSDPWRIDLPPGHYIPLFARGQGSQPVSIPAPPPQEEKVEVAPTSFVRRNALVLGLAIACAGLSAALVWQQLGPSAEYRSTTARRASSGHRMVLAAFRAACRTSTHCCSQSPSPAPCAQWRQSRDDRKWPPDP